MKRVYVAGAYSGPDVLSVFGNMRRGIKMAARLFELGFSPFTPWCDWPLHMQVELDLDHCYRASMAWLEVSDLVVVVQKNSETSKGTQAEILRAKELGIPVFYNISEAIAWRDGIRDDD